MLITLPLMVAMTLVAIDMTIANVALPHMQAALNASQEQILWVLTTYLVAGAIATPLSGWLANRYGRKLVMISSIAGFTVASILCGAANDIGTMCVARALQGASGASLIPIGQAVLLDINPPEQIAKAMTIFSIGSMVGPIIAPTLGGYLTDAISWRWVFFINIPFGVVAFVGMSIFMFESKAQSPPRFDLFGFIVVSVALASFQLMIDRGEHLDWFESREITIYALIAGTTAYLAIVHTMTTKNSFLAPALYKDRNFTVGSLLGIFVGIALMATIPLIVVMTQTLLGYSAFRTGMVGMPRAIGTVVAMIAINRVVNHVDKRVLMMAGLALNAWSIALYAQLDLYTDQWGLIFAGVIQGFAGGMMFLPLSVMVFSTMKPELRNDGAAMFSLTRSIGNAIGIALLQRELIHYSADTRNRLNEGIRPDNPAIQYANPDFDFGSAAEVAGMNAEVSRQAAMVGNVEVYWLVVFLSIAMIPLVLLMRERGKRNTDGPIPAME